jgi:cold shock CspA family protein
MNMIATVSFYNRARGWGFAVPADLSADVYLHCSQMPNERRYVNEGDVIEYDPGIRNDRPIALNVRLIEATPVSSEVRQ